MTITQQTSSRPDFRERAKANDVPVARLIGFEAERIGEGRAAVVLAAGSSMRIPWGRSTAAFSGQRRVIRRASSTCMVLRGDVAGGR